MTKRYRDFDAFFAETKKEPVTIKLFGEVHELGAALPASIVLTMQRAAKEGGMEGTIPQDELLDMAVVLFGQERFEAWTKQGLDLDQLGELIKWTMEEYMGRDAEEPGDPNPEAAQLT